MDHLKQQIDILFKPLRHSQRRRLFLQKTIVSEKDTRKMSNVFELNHVLGEYGNDDDDEKIHLFFQFA